MRYKLGDICDIYDGPHATPPEADTGPVFLGIKNISEQCELVFNDVKHLSEVDYKKWTKRVTPQEDDIVFSYEATLNRYALIPRGFYGCLGRRLAIARVKDINAINPHYLYYYFCSPGWNAFILANKVVGSTVLRVSVEDFPDYEVDLPDIETQNRVAAMLDMISSKRKNNNEICDTLESIAKLLYDYWFVQFDFPDDNGRPYKSSGGKMVWNEELKRDIPEGWSSVRLSSLIDLSKRGDWGEDKPENESDLKVSCIRGADMNAIRHGPVGTSTERYIQQSHVDRLLAYGDFVIEVSGTPGRSTYINHSYLNQNANLIIASNFCQIATMKDPSMLYWFTCLWDELYKEGITSNYSGQTTIQNLQIDILADSLFVPIPENGLIQEFNRKVCDCFESIQELHGENQRLGALRDFLLPMLINGQVKVRKVGA